MRGTDKEFPDKRHSLYIQLLKLLVGAALVSGLLFFVTNTAANYLFDTYYMDEDYTKSWDEKYVKEFQNYINKEQLSTNDIPQIEQWVKKRDILSLMIFYNNALIYDSLNPNTKTQEYYINEMDYDRYYPVEFTDGETLVEICGMYSYRLYTVSFIVEFVLSFLLFFVLVVMGIRQKMNYILLLGREIELLESGNLDYEITVKGKDELAGLAKGLDCMRLSFREQVKREAEMVSENQRMVTEMSHDLRTPITSITLYAEIIKKRTYKNESQLMEYVDKIERKAQRMKQLTDNLFEYSLTTSQPDLALEAPETIQVLFYDLLSEICCYLGEKGFKMVSQVEWEDVRLRVCTGYVTRIMDNITSNILKYADPDAPVSVKSVYEHDMAGFSFENRVRRDGGESQSTEIGLRGIKNMMAKMNGRCDIHQETDRFGIVVLFPVHIEC